MPHHRLENYKLSRRTPTSDLLLMINGSRLFEKVFRKAFPNLHFTRSFEDTVTRNFVWGVYLKSVTNEEQDQVDNFCKLLSVDKIFIENNLDETFALGYHTTLSSGGEFERTSIGELVYGAKSYNTRSLTGNKRKAKDLATRMSAFIIGHPTYRNAEFLLAIPPSNKDKVFDLPTYLVEEIGKVTEQTIANTSISKVRETRPMKECITSDEKVQNIENAFEVKSEIFRGKSVLFIDDIYHTGITLDEVTKTLREAGATQVLGLVATKTIRGG